MDSDELQDKLFSQLSQDEWLAAKHDRYERRMVVRVLRFFGLEKLERTIMNEHKEVTFAGFQTLFTDFPIWLGAQSIPYVHEIGFKRLRAGFTNTKVYEAFISLIDNSPIGYDSDEHESSNFGLIFHWPDLGDVILHDYPISDVRGFRMSWSGLHDRELFLDQLGDAKKHGFLPALAQRWIPSVNRDN